MAASRKPKSTKAATAPDHDDPAAVTAYLAALEHPMKPVVEALRAVILGADPAITEGIKWNSASFYCHGWFATVNVRAKIGVQVVLHHGAKVRDDADLGSRIDDPAGLLKWLSTDRAVIALAGVEDFASKRKAFVALIKQWANYQKQLAKPA